MVDKLLSYATSATKGVGCRLISSTRTNLTSLLSLLGSDTTWLSFLKYFGLGLAAVSSIWGAINDLTTTRGGRRKLTRAGVASIAMTLIGLVTSIVSEDLQRRHEARAQKEQVAAEAKRTNDIIIAGQPLRSLEVTWKLGGFDNALADLLDKGNKKALHIIEYEMQGERSAEQNNAVFREQVLYPFLVWLSRRFADKAVEGNAKDKSEDKERAKDRDGSIVVLFALDDDQGAVLPFGYLEKLKPWGWHGDVEKQKEADSVPSLEVGSHAELGNSDLESWPAFKGRGTEATISWRLDPQTFFRAVNKQNEHVAPTAKLPDSLRIAVLFDIGHLPFEIGNFALAQDRNFWKFPDYHDSQNSYFRGKIDPITPAFTSSVKLVPNNSALVSYHYALDRVYETLFLDGWGEADGHVRCLIFEYRLKE
jgi:hypothetical protein